MWTVSTPASLFPAYVDTRKLTRRPTGCMLRLTQEKRLAPDKVHQPQLPTAIRLRHAAADGVPSITPSAFLQAQPVALSKGENQ